MRFNVRKFNFPLLESPTNVEIKNCKARYHKFGVNVTSGPKRLHPRQRLLDNLNTIDPTRFGIFLGMTEGGGIRFEDVRVHALKTTRPRAKPSALTFATATASSFATTPRPEIRHGASIC